MIFLPVLAHSLLDAAMGATITRLGFQITCILETAVRATSGFPVTSAQVVSTKNLLCGLLAYEVAYRIYLHARVGKLQVPVYGQMGITRRRLVALRPSGSGNTADAEPEGRRHPSIPIRLVPLRTWLLATALPLCCLTAALNVPGVPPCYGNALAFFAVLPGPLMVMLEFGGIWSRVTYRSVQLVAAVLVPLARVVWVSAVLLTCVLDCGPGLHIVPFLATSNGLILCGTLETIWIWRRVCRDRHGSLVSPQ